MAELSLLGFIHHLASFPLHLHHATHSAMEKAAKIVEAEAKRELGTYQTADSPFGAWPDLADRTQNERSKAGFTPDDPGRRTGEMADGIGHAVGDGEAVVGSNDDKMVYFELGTDTQPPRPTLGLAVVHKRKEIEHAIGSAVVAALIGKDVHGGSMPIL